MHVLETYLARLHQIRATERGTPELSYRAALENLLNAVGRGLDPAVHATAELADMGAGRPDFGLFDARCGDLRGAVEVKPVAASRHAANESRCPGLEPLVFTLGSGWMGTLAIQQVRTVDSAIRI
jgi:hypothetical protein